MRTVFRVGKGQLARWSSQYLYMGFVAFCFLFVLYRPAAAQEKPDAPDVPHEFEELADFDGLSIGAVDGKGRWSGSANATVQYDPVDSNNKVLQLKTSADWAAKAFPTSVTNQDNGVLFFRIRRQGLQGIWAGASDVANPREFSDFEVQMGLRYYDPGPFYARSGDQSRALNGLFEENTWYCVWLDMENYSDQYYVHVQGGDFSQRTALFDEYGDYTFDFRNGTANALSYFLARTGDVNGGGTVWIDDIFVNTVFNLSNPSGKSCNGQRSDPCYSLNLNHTGNGSNPSASPGRSDVCVSGQYNAGEAITLQASPSNGWRVGGWSGTDNDSSTGTTNSLTMPVGDHTASVRYTATCYTLTRTHTGSGSDPTASPTSSSGCSTGQYAAGELITLTAAPATGWSVVGWSGADNNSSTANTNTVTMPAENHTVSADYGVNCYRLSVNHSGSGADPSASLSRSDGCSSGQYRSGELIDFTAAPETNWQVDSWSGTNNDASTSLFNSLTMPSRAATVSVTYTAVQENDLALTISIIGQGSVSASPAMSAYPSGTEVTLTATADFGWRFAGWSGDAGGANNPTTFVMDRNKTVVATFVAESTCYALQLIAEGEGAEPTASPANSDGCNDAEYHAGEAISLQASPASGWRVAGWSGTQNNASTSTQNTLQMPSSAHTAGVRYTRVDVGDSSSSSYLPLVKGQPQAVPPPAFPSLVNGDFDVPGDTTWRENTTYDRTIIVSQTYVDSLVQGDFLAHSPPNLAWLGGQVNERATLSQNISLPDGIADIRLAFYHWIGSQDNACGADRAYVNINGSPVIPPLELCYGENTGGWAYREIDLSSYAGQDIELTFLAEQDGEGKSNWFLDNIVLCDGAAAHPCQ
ncbi:MAG: hypothetical protein H6642_06155 [Caldilineaceae bacterium]|nr:hypothetical protein [Caldilineaceae bacterium]